MKYNDTKAILRGDANIGDPAVLRFKRGEMKTFQERFREWRENHGEPNPWKRGNNFAARRHKADTQPAKKPRGRKRGKYHFNTMTVGQQIHVSGNTVSAVHAAHNYGSANGKKFQTWKGDCNGKPGVWIARTK